MNTLPIERDIARELKIKVSQIMEWSTGKIDPHEGEHYVFIEHLGVHVCYKLKEKSNDHVCTSKCRRGGCPLDNG